MHSLIKMACIMLVLVGAFYLAGHMGMWIESLHGSPIAGASAFSVGFLSIMGLIFKFWINLLS